MSNLLSIEVIKERIFFIRGHKVMIDRDLAELYGVSTKALNQAVKRNKTRFPDDFMFHLTPEEMMELVTICDHLQGLKFSYQQPYAFTEQGVAMLSSVLKSDRAIQVNIAIMRAFVQIREILLTHKDLAAKIEALELKYKNHDLKFSEYDKHIAAIFEAIKQLLTPPPEPAKEPIGFGMPKREG